MSNYKIANIIFILAIVLSITIYAFISFYAIYFIVAFICFYIFFLIYGSIDFRLMFYIKTVYHLKTNERVIAISFDDGPAVRTEQILDLLNKYDIKASFFLVGKQIEKYVNTLKRIDKEGHLIGNHSYTHHFWFDMYSAKRMTEELKRTEEIIENNIFKKVKLFRPPYGVTNPALRKAVSKMNYTSVGWSLKSRDTVIKNRQKMEKRLRHKIRPGSVVLFHDTSPEIVEVLKFFIDYVRQCNYKIIRLDELLNIHAYEQADN